MYTSFITFIFYNRSKKLKKRKNNYEIEFYAFLSFWLLLYLTSAHLFSFFICSHFLFFFYFFPTFQNIRILACFLFTGCLLVWLVGWILHWLWFPKHVFFLLHPSACFPFLSIVILFLLLIIFFLFAGNLFATY